MSAYPPTPQVYKLPSLNFDKVATRPTLPVRCVAFSPSGSSIAAAGDEGGIKLVNLADSKVGLLFVCHSNQTLHAVVKGDRDDHAPGWRMQAPA